MIKHYHNPGPRQLSDDIDKTVEELEDLRSCYEEADDKYCREAVAIMTSALETIHKMRVQLYGVATLEDGSELYGDELNAEGVKQVKALTRFVCTK